MSERELTRRRRRKVLSFLVPLALILILPIIGISTFQRYEAKRVIQLAQAGGIRAAMRMARFYSEGIGVEKNERESGRWTLIAAERGHPAAQRDAGKLYRYGLKGFSENRDEAIRWYRMSADQGLTGAMIGLAEMHAENPEDKTALAESYMWVWLVYASRNYEDHVYAEGIIHEGRWYWSASLMIDDSVYDSLGEDAKRMAKRLAGEWRPQPARNIQ